MPEDKARKRAVRARMAQTGERYTTAARKLGAPAYDTNDPCPYCTCCSAYGCHPNPDSGCPWSERLGDFACPCTGGRTRASGEKMLTEQGEQLDKTLKAQGEQLDRTSAEQRTRTLNERFDTVAGQLGSEKPPAVRVAGVYAMAGLADDWQDHRQMCVDVLCACPAYAV